GDWSSDVCTSDLTRPGATWPRLAAETPRTTGVRIHVGSAVIPVQARTPVVLGVSAASLGHVAPGRVALGLGLSSRAIVSDWHGLPFGNSLRQIREAVQIIRLAASGERVNFEGTFYHVKNFRLTAPPP